MAKRTASQPIELATTPGGIADQPELPGGAGSNFDDIRRKYNLPIGPSGVGLEAEPASTNAGLNAAQPFVQESHAIDAQSEKDAETKAAQDFQTHVMDKAPGSLQAIVDAEKAENPELGAQFQAELDASAPLWQNPEFKKDPTKLQDFAATQIKSWTDRSDALNKEKLKNEMEPVFAKWKAEHGDPFVQGKNGKLKEEDINILRTTADAKLQAYPAFKEYIDKLAKQPKQTMGTNYAIPFTEDQLYGLAEDVKNGSLIEDVLPKTRMPPALWSAGYHAVLAMVRGTYKKGSYGAATRNFKPALAPGADTSTPSATPTPGGPGTGTATPTVPAVPAKKPAATPIKPAENGAPAMPDYNPTTDKGDASYANNRQVKQGLAYIKNARSTLDVVGKAFADLDKTRFPTVNAWLTSTEGGAGGTRAQLAAALSIITQDEVGPAFAKGNAVSNQKTDMAKDLVSQLKNASPDAAPAILEALKASLDRTTNALEAPSGRFRKPATPAAPSATPGTKPPMPTKASADTEIAAWLTANGKDASPKSVGIIRKKLGG